jgi:protein phosphatase 1 regulatory subunit 7
MTILDLSSCQLKTLRALEEFPSLSKTWDLLANSNYLREIEKVVGSVSTLRKLHLGTNSISEIQNLDGLTNLIELDLSINRISQIKGLWGLPNLKKLVLFTFLSFLTLV